jgi:hypothetical protein
MITARTAARLALGALVVGSVVSNVSRQNARRDGYAAALARARATGRRLVVVGDPHAGMVTRALPAYGCGDVCVDLGACPACPVSEAVNLDTGRTSVPDDSAVVFVSCVLEYVSDPVAAMREIGRMAGSPDNVFLVVVQPWTLAATFYPGAQRTIARRADGGIDVTPVTTTRKAVLAAGVIALCVVAFRPRRDAR